MIKMYNTVFVLCLSFIAVLAKHEIYEGHTLYNIIVKDVEQAKFINELENLIPVDIWMYASPDRSGQVLVSKDIKQQFLDAVEDADIEYSILTENFKESLEFEEKTLSAGSRRNNRSTSFGLDFKTIHRYEVVDVYLQELANQYPNLVKVASGGRSLDGRDIKYIKISTTNFKDNGKPIVMLQSLLHAREWITLPATLYAIEKLVIDITDIDMVDNIDWIILPIANPDGYEWSHTNARFWRKNRRIGVCVGVDLNRNFDVIWGTGSSSDSCSETFHGANAFSEPEAGVIRDIIREHSDRLEMFIDIHSHGSMLLYGFGNRQLPPNVVDLLNVGVAMIHATDQVKWPEKPNYVLGNFAAVLYPASGLSSDWAQVSGATLAYTYELPSYRGQGGLIGFLVDPNFIEQAGYETWEGIKAGVREATNRFYSRKTEKEAILP